MIIKLEVYFTGAKSWHKNGLKHREFDQPAIISSDAKSWYKNGRCHRDNDQPSVMYSDGYNLWYENGFEIRK